MKKSLLLYCLIFIQTIAFSQVNFKPGFVIKSNGDSVAGFLNKTKIDLNSSIEFKSSPSSKRISFYPADLKSFGFEDGQYFGSINLTLANGKKVLAFTEYIVRGLASYLQYKNDYFLLKDGVIFPITSETYVTIINEQFAECDLKADMTAYEPRKIAYIVQNYNRCKGIPGKVYDSNTKRTVHVYLNGFAAFEQSSLTVNGMEDAFKPSTTITGGVGGDFSFPFSDAFLFSVEAWYGKRFYQGYAESTGASGTVRQDILMDASFLKIPLGVRYNFLREGRTPYVRAGIVKYFLLNTSYNLRSETENNGKVLTTAVTPPYTQKGQDGFWVSLGYSTYVKNDIQGFGEIRYEKTSGTVGLDIERTAGASNISIIVGIRF